MGVVDMLYGVVGGGRGAGQQGTGREVSGVEEGDDDVATSTFGVFQT